MRGCGWRVLTAVKFTVLAGVYLVASGAMLVLVGMYSYLTL